MRHSLQLKQLWGLVTLFYIFIKLFLLEYFFVSAFLVLCLFLGLSFSLSVSLLLCPFHSRCVSLFSRHPHFFESIIKSTQ